MHIIRNQTRNPWIFPLTETVEVKKERKVIFDGEVAVEEYIDHENRVVEEIVLPATLPEAEQVGKIELTNKQFETLKKCPAFAGFIADDTQFTHYEE